MNFEQAIRSAGLLPRSIIADGKIHRCPTEAKPRSDNGWFALHPDGHGVWGDWASGEQGSWKDANATHRAADPTVQARMKRQRDNDRAYRVRAMRSAREYWAAARPLLRPHKYIGDKGLSQLGCSGLRTHDGLLVVPVWHGQWLISVQTIAPDGEKLFWPGAPVKSGAYVIERKNHALTVITEGLSTGLAVYQSVRNARVVVAFNAGNLFAVADRLKPTGSVCIAADNDWRTLAKIGVNPGIEKARNAAELIGCGVAYPNDIEGTDWADYIKEVGAGAGRKLERAVLAQARYVMGAAP